MHAIDHLIGLASLRGTLDLRCRLRGNWALPHGDGPAGEASYHIVLAGECRLELAGQPPIPLRAGQVLLLPRSQAHTLAAGMPDPARQGLEKVEQAGRVPLIRAGRQGAPLEMLCGRLFYTPSALLLSALPDVVRVDVDHAGEPGRLGALIELMRLEAEGGQMANQSVVDGLSLILFTLVLRAQFEREQMPPGIFGLLRDKRLGRAAMALLGDLSQDWPVQALAELANMSRSNFMRAFAQAAGTSPAALLTRLRMERARQLLSNTAASVGSIALDVGYQSLASFSRVFKQQVGESPARYRERHGRLG